jgi:acetolactate synthase-1/2/3 large subunit
MADSSRPWFRAAGLALAPTQCDTTYYTTLSNVSVGELLLRYLRLEGVDVVFGVPGKGISWLIYQLAFSQSGDAPGPADGIRYVVARHDGTAAFMADGYARVSGKLGVCVVTSGPGATNTVTGATCAQVDGSSVLFVTGEVPEAAFGRGAFQEGADSGIDIVGLFRACTAYSARVTSPSNFQTLLTQAIRVATSLPRLASHLNLPEDVSETVLPTVQFPTARHHYVAVADGGNPTRSRQAAHDLRDARRPLIYLGSGARDAFVNPQDPIGSRRRLHEFMTHVVDKHGIPVMTTPRAKGIFPESHPLSLRNYGMAACQWPQYYMNQHLYWPEQPPYDALLVLGTALKQWSTNAWDPMLVPHGPITQVDLDASIIARAFPVESGIVGNCATVIDEIIAVAKELDPSPEVAARKAFIAQLKSHSPWADGPARLSDATPVKPQRVMAELQHVLDTEPSIRARGAHVFVDVGNTMGWTWHELVIEAPVQLWTNTGMASMGWGSGAVIGGKMADPTRPAICVTGDGGFFMNGKDVSTAVQHGVGAVWIVFQDDVLQMVTQGMTHTWAPPQGHTWADYYSLGNADLVQYSQSLGADAFLVTAPGELADLLPKCLHTADEQKKPQVIVVQIDRTEAPPYPAPKPFAA